MADSGTQIYVGNSSLSGKKNQLAKVAGLTVFLTERIFLGGVMQEIEGQIGVV